MLINLSKYSRIGFTGTENGMTFDQEVRVDIIIGTIEIEKRIGWGLKHLEFHHGDCVGSDETFHRIVVKAGFGEFIVIHPPINSSLQAFCKEGKILEPKPYIERDVDIANALEILLATPCEYDEVTRSGTWTTIRHARKMRKTIIIIFPDGETRVEKDTV